MNKNKFVNKMICIYNFDVTVGLYMTSQFDLLEILLIKQGLSIYSVWVLGRLPCNVNVHNYRNVKYKN